MYAVKVHSVEYLSLSILNRADEANTRIYESKNTHFVNIFVDSISNQLSKHFCDSESVHFINNVIIY